MAHIEKYKAHSVGHMLAHYRRDPSSLERDNIDPTRTGRNVTFGRVRILDEHGRPMLNDAGGERWRVQPVDWKPNWDTVSERIERVNADALRGWQDRFFEKVSKPWGLERGEKDTGRTHKDAAQMRRDAEREIKELDKRKECLRQEVEEMEAATPSLPEGVRTLWKARNDGSREDTLGSDLEGLRSQISDLSSQIADVDRRADEIERGLPILRARRASLGERFGVARAAVVKAIEGLREVPNIVSAWAQELARKMGKHLFDPNSIDYRSREMWEATRAVDALNRDRPHVPQQRGRGAR